MSNKTVFSNKRGDFFDSDNNNFRVVEALGLTSDYNSEPIVIMDSEFTLQINVQGSSSFDVSLQQSIDCVYWGDFSCPDQSGTLVDESLRSGVGSGDSPFTYSICGSRYRYIRVLIRNIVGTLNLEVYKI